MIYLNVNKQFLNEIFKRCTMIDGIHSISMGLTPGVAKRPISKVAMTRQTQYKTLCEIFIKRIPLRKCCGEIAYF